jgi:thiol-disulfide isomerase/thioredoxin
MKDGSALAGGPTRRLALCGLALIWAGAARAGELTAEQRKAFDWPALTLLDGRALAPESWRDTAAVVVFWATWCPFCRRHNARIEQLHRLAAGPHLRILSVALDGDEASVQRYMTANDFHFPVVVGRPELRQLFTPRRVIPMTCVVDRGGHLLQSIPGEMAEADVLALAAFAGPSA